MRDNEIITGSRARRIGELARSISTLTATPST